MFAARSMRFNYIRQSLIVAWLVFSLYFPLHAQSKSAASGTSAASLDAVLTQMDTAAAQFRNAEADFKADNFEKVVNETDTQTGKIYFRRTGKGDMEMASDFQAP